MNNSKRIVSVMLTLVMVLSIFCVVPFSVTAAKKDVKTTAATPDEPYPEIKTGETITVDINNAGDIVFLRFVPEKDMEINFFGVSDYDTFGYIYDEEYVELASDDDSGEGLNFHISLAVKGGSVYYMAANFLNSDMIGSFDVTLEGNTSSTQSEFEYRLMDDNTVEIESYRGSKSNIVIPDNIDGYTVTGIGKYAFFEKEFERVIVANTVTYIDRGAFDGCVELKEIILGANLASIGVSAFMECKSLEAIELPESVKELENSAFAYCSALKSITIPEGITAIHEGTFFDCKSMQSISLPKSIQVIDDEALGYYMTDKGQESLCKSDFIIRGYQDTVAETYAVEHNFKFVSLDGIADRAVGDSDGDGVVTVMDATDIQYTLSMGVTIEDEMLEYVDIDRNKRLEIVDAAYVQRSVAKIKIPYTVGDKKGEELEKSVRHISYNASGEIIGESEVLYNYIFDDKGNAVQSIHLQNGEIVSSVKYTYNAVGDRMKESRYNQDGELFEEIEYNEAGLEISSTNYLSSYVYKKEYDGYGNQTRYAHYRDGSLTSDYITVYEYDEEGNIKESITYRNDLEHPISKVEFNESHDMIKDWSYDDAMGSWRIRSLYTYDDKHNMRSSYLYDSDGIIRDYTDYWYDKDNRLTAYYSGGSGHRYSCWTYTYDDSGYLINTNMYENGILEGQTKFTYYK